jgi:hypothetical protein
MTVDWTTLPIRDGITALSLMVACLSLFISYRTAQRQNAEKSVNAWITMIPQNAEWWLATLHVTNGSHVGVDINQLFVPLPDYRLCDPAQAKYLVNPGEKTTIDLSGCDHHLSMPFRFGVDPEGTEQKAFLLYQPTHSRCKKTKITVYYNTREARPRRKGVIIPVRTRGDY